MKRMMADLFYIKYSKKYKEKGLFAKRFVPKGTIMDFRCKNCKTYSKEEFEKLPKKERQFIINHEVIEEGLYTKFCDKRMLYDNHSCDANTMSSSKGFGIVVRDIAKGEEVTSDYRQGEEEVHFTRGCKCGAKNCMGKRVFKPPATKKLQRFWSMRTNSAMKLISTVKQPLRRRLLSEHPDLSYLFEKKK